MSYAVSVLAPAPSRLDHKRIIGYSVSIALNAAALIALMMPSAIQLPQRTLSAPALTVTFQPPPKVIPELPVPPPPTLPVHQSTPPVHHSHVVNHSVSPAPVVTEASPVAVSASPAPVLTENSATPSATLTGPLSESALAYVVAPPPVYPAHARRMLWQGTVVLKVLVDIDGQPLQVLVERSSGHRELDQAARAQILARWRFEPATIEGQLSQAWARVPVTFKLK